MSSGEEWALDTCVRIVVSWLKHSGTSRPDARGAVAPVIRRFRAANTAIVPSLLKAGGHLHGKDFWIVGAPIKGQEFKLYPVATISTRFEGDNLCATVRVALFFDAGGHTAHVVGWRFETAETLEGTGRPDPPHPYNHAQSIAGWWLDLRCLHHPHRESGSRQPDCMSPQRLDQRRPAFPLRGETTPGLMVAMLACLYGAEETKKMLRLDRKLRADRQFVHEVAEILGTGL